MSGLYDYSGTSEPWVPIPKDTPYDWDEDVECPDCDTLVPLGALKCPNPACGLTLAEVAERLAR